MRLWLMLSAPCLQPGSISCICWVPFLPLMCLPILWPDRLGFRQSRCAHTGSQPAPDVKV